MTVCTVDFVVGAADKASTSVGCVTCVAGSVVTADGMDRRYRVCYGPPDTLTKSAI